MIKSSLSKSFLFLGLSSLMVFTACSDDSESPEQFDRGNFLEYSADEKIIPAYQDLLQELTALETVSNAFLSSPEQGLLQELQNQWIQTHESWQRASIYNFGPAGAKGLSRNLLEEIATFPINRNALEDKILNGESAYNDFQRDTRGLLAIEYLIFSAEKNDEVIIAFQDNNRRNYLIEIVSNCKTKVEGILSEWNDEYRAEFISNNGTDAGSSTSLLYNEFVKSFEVLKNFKLGVPLGIRAGQTQTEPGMVEAYYSGRSLLMLRINFEAMADFWYGNQDRADNSFGFKYYLQNVEGGNSLISATEVQISNVRQQLELQDYNTPMSEQITAGNQNLIDLHTELQKLTRFFKSDLSSLIGIAITFDSGDGD